MLQAFAWVNSPQESDDWSVRNLRELLTDRLSIRQVLELLQIDSDRLNDRRRLESQYCTGISLHRGRVMDQRCALKVATQPPSHIQPLLPFLLGQAPGIKHAVWGDDVGLSRPMRCQRRKRSEEHTSELQSQFHLVCRLLL